MLWICMLHIFAAPVETMHTGHDLRFGDTASPLPSPSWTPNMPPGSTLLGPSPLVRGMSGSGLGRLQRVGSNPINDMNRHSFSQVLTSRLIALVSASVLCACMYASVLCACMYASVLYASVLNACMYASILYACMYESVLYACTYASVLYACVYASALSWQELVLVAACSNTAADLLHAMLSCTFSFLS